MQMTSRERVLSVFAHEKPDRVPCWCGSSDEFWVKAKAKLSLGGEELLEFLGDDFRRIKAPFVPPDTTLKHAHATYKTQFGIEREGLGYGQPIGHPLAHASLDEVHAYPWPDPAWNDVTKLKEQAAAWNGKYAILGGDWSPFWHDAIDLMGMESMMMGMLENPDLIDAVMTHLVDYYAATSERIFEVAADEIDIFFIGNDLGTQHGPPMSEALMRRFIEPHLRHLADLGHSYGLKVMMHCCGGIIELFPMFIDAGLDGIHALQPQCRGMDLQKLKTDFGDKIVLNGAIDSHHILINGTPESVRQSTREVLEIMMPGGGYIAGASHDTILEETPVENVVAMFEAIKEFGVYG